MMSMSKEARVLLIIVSSIAGGIVAFVLMIQVLIFIIRLIPADRLPDVICWGAILFVTGTCFLGMLAGCYESLVKNMEAKEQKDWHDTHPF